MTLEEFIKRDSVIDLSFFNFSNAITAAYFASNELEVLRVNSNFKKFFPVLKNVTNILFPSVLEQLGVDGKIIDEFKNGLKTDGAGNLSFGDVATTGKAIAMALVFG